MGYGHLETDCIDSYNYGAYCRKCKHSARLSLPKLRAHLGDTFPLVKIRDKLRCERCRSRQIVITFLAVIRKYSAARRLVKVFGKNTVAIVQ